MATDAPDLVDVLEAWFGRFERNLHTAFPAKVASYNAQTQTADLTPMVKRALEDEDGNLVSEALPRLPNVPLLFPRMGPWFLSLPVAVGDWVLVVCCESSIGHVRAAGDVVEPGDLRRHHLSHAVALPGFFPTSLQLTAVSATDLVLGKNDGTRLSIGRTGEVVVQQGNNVVLRIDPDGTVNLGAAAGAQFVALAQKVDDIFSSLKDIFDGWTPVPNDGGLALKQALTGPLPLGWRPGSVAATKTKAT